MPVAPYDNWADTATRLNRRKAFRIALGFTCVIVNERSLILGA